MTLLQLAVLAELNDAGPMTPGQLAAAQRVQPQSLTRVLATLEARGLLGRQADPGDGRRALLAITDDGHQALRRDVDARDAGWPRPWRPSSPRPSGNCSAWPENSWTA